MSEEQEVQSTRGSFGKWQPKKWKPKYEQIVALSCAGWQNNKIAELFNMTPQQVCNIVTSDKAEEIKSKAVAAIRGTTVESIPAKLEKLAETSIRNMQAVLDNKKLLEDSPFAIFDRSSKVLEGVGHLKTKEVPAGGNFFQQNNRLAVLPIKEADELAKALMASAQASTLHPIPVQAIPIENDEA